MKVVAWIFFNIHILHATVYCYNTCCYTKKVGRGELVHREKYKCYDHTHNYYLLPTISLAMLKLTLGNDITTPSPRVENLFI